jgi:hypothetical protein
MCEWQFGNRHSPTRQQKKTRIHTAYWLVHIHIITSHHHTTRACLGVRQTQKVAHAMRMVFQKERETRLHVAVGVRAAKGEVVQEGEGAAKTESDGDGRKVR